MYVYISSIKLHKFKESHKTKEITHKFFFFA